VGFLAGIYLPMGMLPDKVQTVLKCFPLVHGSSFLREAFTEQIIADTFVNCPKELIDGYKEAMGITLMNNDQVISDGFKIAFLIISGVLFLVISALMQKRRNVMSR
jgi:multidrug/hemolysin transport system permease protein